jgi:hypothetical protein
MHTDSLVDGIKVNASTLEKKSIVDDMNLKLSFPQQPYTASMAILSAPEPPKQQHSYKRGYGSVTPSFNRRTSRSEPANPASPFKSPLPRKSDLPSDLDASRASGSSPPPSHAPSSSQLSSPPSLGERELPDSPRRDREVEEDMEVEEVQRDDDEEEEEEDIGRSVKDIESDDESMLDDRPIVHSKSTGCTGCPPVCLPTKSKRESSRQLGSRPAR